MAFDPSRPADMAWLGNNQGAFQNPILMTSPVTFPVDSGTYPQPGQFAMPSLPVIPTVAELPTDPVLAAYLNAAKTPSSAGVAATQGPSTGITYQTSAGTASKPAVFIVLIVLAVVAFYFFKKKGALNVG